jgi:hypothetical protein
MRARLNFKAPSGATEAHSANCDFGSGSQTLCLVPLARLGRQRLALFRIAAERRRLKVTASGTKPRNLLSCFYARRNSVWCGFQILES